MSTGAPGGGLAPGSTGREHAMRRVSDLARELGKDARTIRRWAVKHLGTADLERRRRPGGGAPELWVTYAGAEAIRAAYAPGAPGEAAANRPGPPDSSPGAPGAEAGWLVAVGQLRADLDAALSQLQVVTQQRDVALQRAAEAERAAWAAGERLASLRASVALWYAAAARLPWWRRARGLPPLPADVTGAEPRLAPPGQGS